MLPCMGVVLTAAVLISVSALQALGSTLSQVRNRPVDVVLYLSRLDEFRVDASDVQASIRMSCLLIVYVPKDIPSLYGRGSPLMTEVIAEV